MCGFLGVISNSVVDENLLHEANKFQICRGPDECKSIFDKVNNKENNIKFDFGFIFNRLAIQDLTKTGSQPMKSELFNTQVMFNGEIFNHKELRRELESLDIKFNSNNSDTEVVLNGLSYFGEQFIEKMIGQFSIFFIDFKNNSFMLIRDRLGQKPLFYSASNNNIIFSSNLKSIISYFKKFQIDKKSIIDYIEYGVVPAPRTIFKNIYKLKPGEIINGKINNDGIKIQKKIYWDPNNYVNENEMDIEYFEKLLHDSIQIRTKADVKVASFLSGGLDSTYIVKILSENKKIKDTFTVKFTNSKYDESNWAKQVIDFYNVNSIIVDFNIEKLGNHISEAINGLDEPYSDPSIVPSYIISKSISKNFKVAISGDGGDELFCGYDRTYKSLVGWKFPEKFISFAFRLYPYFLGSGAKILSRSNNFKMSYKSFLSDIKLKNLIFKNENGYFDLIDSIKTSESKFKSVMVSDFNFYLPEMMLLKVDRTSMSSSLEVRSPFVDHRLIEYVLSCNIDNFNNWTKKKFLKDRLEIDLGSNFVNRKKMGFVFDIENLVFNNADIKNTIDNGYLNKFYKITYKKLSKFKSNLNAQRIWKIYTIEKYINSFNHII